MDKKKSTVVGVAGGALFGYVVAWELSHFDRFCDYDNTIPACEFPTVCPVCGGSMLHDTGSSCPKSHCPSCEYVCQNPQIVSHFFGYLPFIVGGAFIGGALAYFLWK